MTPIPADVYDAMFRRLGHTLHEYEGLAAALYAHELKKLEEAAPIKDRPLFMSGATLTSKAGGWGVVDRTKGFRALYKTPANAI